MKTTLLKLLEESMQQHGETMNDMVHCTITGEQLRLEFNHAFGTGEGIPFILWTQKSVYYSHHYDGLCYVARLPRNPWE